MADFMATREIKLLPPYLVAGIELHKAIDQYTDQHEDVKKSIHMLRPTQKKYSPVVVDILYDFFLIKNWNQFSDESFDRFKGRTYGILTSNAHILPEKLQEILPKMISDDFLMSCCNEERLNRTFERLKKRAHFPNNFENVTVDLKNHFHELEKKFLSFFPDLVRHVQPYCNCTP